MNYLIYIEDTPFYLQLHIDYIYETNMMILSINSIKIKPYGIIEFMKDGDISGNDWNTTGFSKKILSEDVKDVKHEFEKYDYIFKDNLVQKDILNEFINHGNANEYIEGLIHDNK